MSIQAEVLTNIRSERIGAHTVADLNLPDPFLRRVADRIIRESFENRHRLVVADQPGGAEFPAESQAQSAPNGAPRTVLREVSPRVLEYRAALREDRPERRNFRAPILDRADQAPPVDLRPDELDPAARSAAACIAKGLAPDGILLTLARVINALGLARFERAGVDELALLDRIGLPTDLLQGFSETGSAQATVQEVAAVSKAAGSPEACRRALARKAFCPSASCPEFRAAADSGQEPLLAVRVQATSGRYWTGPGDGGCLDLLGQLAGALPAATITASVERKHLDAFAAHAARWPGTDSRATIVAEDLPVAQWTQDNGKSGWDARGNPIVLVPRYASRGELGAVFVPGETFLAEGLAQAGMRIVQSPLLFQGGNLVLVDEGPRRTLLLGEAEVWRNAALGLSKEQAIEAFRVQFGADCCTVLPAASFHIDFEVSVRATPSGIVALVADAPAAARLIMDCAISTLAVHARISAGDAATARGHVSQGRIRECLSIVGPVVGNAAIGPGRFPEAFAACFSTGPSDHGPSNLYRVLLALDLLSALTAAPAELPKDPHARAYLESFRHVEADRHLLRRQLRDAGYQTVPIPSLAEPYRGLTALNGLHEPGRYLMPAYGGLFAPVDAAAESAISKALADGARIVPITCAETQRRSGALRCAVSLATIRRPFGL